MGGSEAQLTGPDLTKGIEVASLADGAKLLGHVHGDPVLLARVGDEYFAIGASCTHYGGPLAEGVIADGTVRCPWHHACFDLRSGEALRAPALSPVACYAVTREHERIVVGQKQERDPLAPTYPVRAQASPEHVVIVGAGAAGSAAAEMLRRCGYDGRITMIDAEQASPYDRPNLSKDYLAGNAPEEWIPLRPENFYSEHRIDVVRGTVKSLDVQRNSVEVEGREAVGYHALILATGAEPVHLGLDGGDRPMVHYLRSLADSRSIIAAARKDQRAVVIGSSFIGLEVAASLRTRGLSVDVVSPDALPLERVLGKELGTFIKALHEEKGVRFHLGHKPARFDENAVVLDDGTRLDADLVVVGVGVKPRTGIAEAAGLTMNRGVAVDALLRTSAPNVYAAGDIARWPDPHSGADIRVEHWVVAQRMGQTAARNVLGANEPFNFVPFFWSAHYDVSINYVGHAEQWDDIKVDGDPAKHDVSVRFEKGDKLLALATIFRDTESLETELSMERALAK